MNSKPKPSRTVNPLHFEDLEPHRLEDLVRQLIYDFRDWRQLEPIGRTGHDDGVDICGLEAGSGSADDPTPERTWFVQVKRERRIGPARAAKIADEALAAAAEPPYGFVLTAPCDFSKRSRDAVRTRLMAAGVTEVHLWGKADLEDRLYLPHNDHLLFAYFGISLRIRRRNRAAELSSRLTTKRQIFKTIGDLDHRGFTEVLIRDPDEAAYPFAEKVEGFAHDPAWRPAVFRSHYIGRPDHLSLIIERRHAWLSEDRTKWDAAGDCSHLTPGRGGATVAEDEEACERLWRYFHNEVPRENRAWLETYGLIPYDDILVLDDLGDPHHPCPHLLVNRAPGRGFFVMQRQFVRPDHHDDDDLISVEELRRSRMFPAEIPDVKWRRDW